MNIDQRQLSLEVLPHPDLSDDTLIVGTLAIKGTMRVPRNLNAGDELRVIVQDADGVVLCSGLAEAESPAFKTIKEKGIPIGQERVHKAAIVE